MQEIALTLLLRHSGVQLSRELASFSLAPPWLSVEDARLHRGVVDHANPARKTNERVSRADPRARTRAATTHAPKTTKTHASSPTLLYSAALASPKSRRTSATHSAGVVAVWFSATLVGVVCWYVFGASA